MDKGIRYHTGWLQKAAVWLALSACLFSQSTIAEAIKLTRERRYQEADRALSGIAEPVLIDQRIAFHRLKAAVASGLKEYGKAATEMQSALALAPQNSNLLLATAMAELEAGKLDEALKHAHESGDNGLAASLSGDIEERRGNYLAAAQAYQSAVKFEPGEEGYRIALGVELMKHQTFGAASEVLGEATKSFPKSAKIRELLGIAQYAAGYSDDGVKSLEASLTLDSKLTSAYRCLSQIVLQSSAAPSERSHKLLCDWDRTVCSAVQLRIARESGDKQLQADSIAQLKQVQGDDATARCELGRAYEWSGQLTDARLQMQECVRLDPSPQNYYRLGLLYRKLGLNDLSRREMELRARTLKTMSDETALGLNALENFEQSAK